MFIIDIYICLNIHFSGNPELYLNNIEIWMESPSCTTQLSIPVEKHFDAPNKLGIISI